LHCHIKELKTIDVDEINKFVSEMFGALPVKIKFFVISKLL
jgi:hypothetical protein